jgi:hypothetical protein
LAVVQQAIEDGGGDHRVAEHAEPLQLLVDPNQRQPLAARLTLVDLQQPGEIRRPGPRLGSGCTARSQENPVCPERTSLRTVFRDTQRARAIPFRLVSSAFAGAAS